MQYKTLGNTGVLVSQLCLGTMTFGRESDQETSAAVYRRCREAGVNFFDCANVYANGESEKILGALIAPEREKIILTSKAFFPVGTDVNDSGASRKHLRQAVEDSLRRLNTDYIDVYFIHRFDTLTPLSETLRTLDDLVRQGKILYPAASNFAAWQVEKALGISAREGWARFECLQPMYNLVKRQAEVEILPMAQAENLGVIPYSPLGGGLLTGKYSPERAKAADPRFGDGRLTGNKIYQSRYGDDWMYTAAAQFSDFARQHGYTPAALAVAWVGSHPAVTAPIIGGRSVEQIEASLAAIAIPMTPELRAEISAFTPEPPLSTDRTEERTDNSFMGARG